MLHTRAQWAIVAACLGLCQHVDGHELWLVPPSERAAVGEPVQMVVAVGMEFPISTHAIDPSRLTMMARGPRGETAEVSIEKREDERRTIATWTPTSEGVWLVSAVTRPSRIEMEAMSFNKYLLHDGLPHILAQRMEDGEMEMTATEQYSKYVKALIDVGVVGESGEGGSIERQLVGMTLEIRLLNSPYQTAVGDTLTAQVYYENQPLPNAHLGWDHPGSGERFSGQTWTDDKGKALIPIAQSGLMTLRLIHMTRPRAEDYEWESFWSTLTFRVP